MALNLLLASNEYIYQENIWSTTEAFTMMCWFRMTDESARQGIMGAGGYGSHGTSLRMTSGGVLEYAVAGPSSATGSTLSFDTWYHVAQKRLTDTTHETFFNGVSDITHTSGGGNLYHPYFGQSSDAYTSEAMSGRLAAVKVFTANLSAAEIQQEMYFFMPVRTDNLTIWSPFVADETVNFRDYSGNGNDWIENGTITAGAGPPITWRKGASRIFLPAAAAADISHVAALADSFDNVVQRRPIKVTNF